MTNKQLIYQFIQKETEKNLSENRFDFEHNTAVTIAKELYQDRTNVSRILNELFREEKLIKITGRPTKYISRSSLLEHFPFSDLPNVIGKEKGISSYLQFQNQPNQTSFAQSFHMIGANKNGSLYENINRILSFFYLPRNMAKIIVLQGEPGTGKKYFLEEIHTRCIELSLIPNSQKIHYFDFFDFFNHIDQYINKILEKQIITIALIANQKIDKTMINTILQRMDIAFLNQSQKFILALICTNETDNIPFLQYTPYYLKFPSIKNRPLIEYFDLLILFIQNEAQRVSRTIKLTRGFAETLYENTINIHQMKENVVQLVSYSLFLANQHADQNDIVLDEELIQDFLQCSHTRLVLDTFPIADVLVIQPNITYDQIIKEENKEEFKKNYLNTTVWHPNQAQTYYYNFISYNVPLEYSDIKLNTSLYAVRKIINKHLFSHQPDLLNYTSYKIMEEILHPSSLNKRVFPTEESDEMKNITHRISNSLENQKYKISSDTAEMINSILKKTNTLVKGTNIPIILISKYDLLIEQYANLLNLYFQKNIIHIFFLTDEANQKIDDQIEHIFNQVLPYDKGQGIILFTDSKYRSKIGNRFFIYSSTLSHCNKLTSFLMLLKTVSEVVKNNTNVLNITPDILVQKNYEKEYLKNCDLNQYAERTDDPELILINKVMPGINNFETNEQFYKLLKKITKKIDVPLSNLLIRNFIFHCNCILFEHENNILLRTAKEQYQENSLVHIIQENTKDPKIFNGHHLTELDYLTLGQVIESHLS